nr:MAG TPA: hypothetical protein [Caudoviricetes sp.]
MEHTCVYFYNQTIIGSIQVYIKSRGMESQILFSILRGLKDSF